MPPAEMRDFYAIAVYFASLSIWAYGHLTTSKDTPKSSPKIQDEDASFLKLDARFNGNFIVLNSEETSSFRPFIAGRQITPVLATVTGNHSDSFISLDNPNSVLQMARSLYRGNFPIEDEPMPPLVENMGNLMRDLCGASGSRFSRRGSPVGRETTHEGPHSPDGVDVNILSSG